MGLENFKNHVRKFFYTQYSLDSDITTKDMKKFDKEINKTLNKLFNGILNLKKPQYRTLDDVEEFFENTYETLDQKLYEFYNIASR